MEFAKCPICGKNITSDAGVRNYCRLCGMGSQGAFCCEGCEEKFHKIRVFRNAG